MVAHNRGTLNYYREAYQAAIDDFSQAIALNPQDADSYYNRASCYIEIGDTQKAIADYQEVVKINGDPEAVKQLRSLGADIP